MSLFNKLILVGLVTFLSCDATKNVAEDSGINKEPMVSKEDMEGFSLGIIEYVKNSDCSYMIVDEKSGEKFDPINFDKKEYLDFKKDKQLIYYKYRRLRMANRCNNIQPVEIESIKKRED